MKKILAVFILFFFFINYSSFSQTAENTEAITVFKKVNPKISVVETKSENIIITTDKMKNPNKKEEEKDNTPDAIITDQKQRNPKSPH